jgi:hypothetical protein
MTVTTTATVRVRTVELRAALAAVFPHRKRTKRDDDIVLHRVRLILANGTAYAGATQGVTTALAKMKYMPITGGLDTGDTRGNLWEPDDGPLVIDLRPDVVKIWLQMFAAARMGKDEDLDPVTAITYSFAMREVEFENEGGGTASGERFTIPLADPAEQFPDLIDISGRALAEADSTNQPRVLKQSADVVKLFEQAGKQYGAPLRFRQTGSAPGSGFVVECGSSFVGTMTSEQGDEATKRDGQLTLDWLNELKPRKLASA